MSVVKSVIRPPIRSVRFMQVEPERSRQQTDGIGNGKRWPSSIAN